MSGRVTRVKVPSSAAHVRTWISSTLHPQVTNRPDGGPVRATMRRRTGASSYQRGTCEGSTGSGSVTGGGASCSAGRQCCFFHCQRTCKEERTLPTKIRCGICFLARYSGVTSQCFGSPVASSASWGVTSNLKALEVAAADGLHDASTHRPNHRIHALKAKALPSASGNGRGFGSVLRHQYLVQRPPGKTT